MTKYSPRKYPGFLIRRLQQVSVSLFLNRLRAFGITPLQYTILQIVKGQPGIDQISVASQAVLDASTVKDIVARLESKGLVVRSTGQRDRRTRAVSLTRAGADLLAACEPEVRATRKALLAPLNAEERETLLQLLNRVLSAHEGDEESPQLAAPWRRFS